MTPSRHHLMGSALRRRPGSDPAAGSRPSRAPGAAGAPTRSNRRPTLRAGGELRTPPLEHALLGVVVHERERALVGGARLVGAAKPPQELAAGGVEVAVVLEREAVDDPQAGLR